MFKSLRLRSSVEKYATVMARISCFLQSNGVLELDLQASQTTNLNKLCLAFKQAFCRFGTQDTVAPLMASLFLTSKGGTMAPNNASGVGAKWIYSLRLVAAWSWYNYKLNNPSLSQ
jgi:hypothetical protein